MVKNGVPADRAHYIPTFPVITPLPPLDRATLNTPPGAKVLLTLSRLHQKKGLDTFLYAVKDLPDCVAWLAGDGPLQVQLEKLAEITWSGKVAPWVELRGESDAWIERAVVFVALVRAD